jgi:hypothetical protein
MRTLSGSAAFVLLLSSRGKQTSLLGSGGTLPLARTALAGTTPAFLGLSLCSSAYSFVDIRLPGARQAVNEQTFTFIQLNRAKLRIARRREGRYLLRSNLCEQMPIKLWELYIQLTQVEEAFKNIKGDLAIRPIYDQRQERIEAHIFIAFLAYCLQVTLTRRLRDLAPGLTAHSVLDKFADVQMIDVHLPTSDGRQVIFSRYTQPEDELKLLLRRLKLELPAQAPPRITATGQLCQ